MAVRLTDSDIQRLLTERKPLPEDFRNRTKLKSKRGHKESELALKGVDGSEFLLFMRQSEENPIDFSIILTYQIPKSNVVFRLLRCNGKSHEHTNKIEGNTFYDFHIHQATERYQDSGFQEDTFAEPTRDFSDFAGALDCLLKQGAFDVRGDLEFPLFDAKESP